MAKKKDDVAKKEMDEKAVVKTPVEAIEDRLKAVQNEHSVLTKNKKQHIDEINKINEELVKFVGAYNELMKLKNELDPPKAPDVKDPAKEEKK